MTETPAESSANKISAPPRPANPLQIGEEEKLEALRAERERAEAQKERERVRALQDKAIERIAQLRDNSGKHMADLSAIAIRSPGIAAAAGIAAILGYVSTNFERLEPQIGAYSAIVFFFLVSLLVSVVVSGTTYLSQLAYFYSLNAPVRLDHDPWAQGAPKQRLLGFIGAVLHAMNIVLVAASYIVLGFGFFRFFLAFSSPVIPEPPPPNLGSSEPSIVSAEPSLSSSEGGTQPSEFGN